MGNSCAQCCKALLPTSGKPKPSEEEHELTEPTEEEEEEPVSDEDLEVDGVSLCAHQTEGHTSNGLSLGIEAPIQLLLSVRVVVF